MALDEFHRQIFAEPVKIAWFGSGWYKWVYEESLEAYQVQYHNILGAVDQNVQVVVRIAFFGAHICAFQTLHQPSSMWLPFSFLEASTGMQMT